MESTGTHVENNIKNPYFFRYGVYTVQSCSADPNAQSWNQGPMGPCEGKFASIFVYYRESTWWRHNVSDSGYHMSDFHETFVRKIFELTMFVSFKSLFNEFIDVNINVENVLNYFNWNFMCIWKA